MGCTGEVVGVVAAKPGGGPGGCKAPAPAKNFGLNSLLGPPNSQAFMDRLPVLESRGWVQALTVAAPSTG